MNGRSEWKLFFFSFGLFPPHLDRRGLMPPHHPITTIRPLVEKWLCGTKIASYFF